MIEKIMAKYWHVYFYICCDTMHYVSYEKRN